jgi:1-acyl-sn-glycerol-3-phosphate acyltransferase
VWALAPLRLAYKLWFGLMFFGSLLLLYPLFRILLSRRTRYQGAFSAMRAWANFLQWACLVPQRITWKGTLPEAPYVICSNHASYLDIIHMYNTVPHYFLFMGKNELRRWPLFRIFFRDMNIAVDRARHAQAARSLVKAGRAIDQGASVALFPEGTIPDHAPRMKPFKDGAFKLAISKQVPIVPITFVNHWCLFGEPTHCTSRGRPGIARAVVHPPIPTKGLAQEDLIRLRNQVFHTIQGPLLPYGTGR